MQSQLSQCNASGVRKYWRLAKRSLKQQFGKAELSRMRHAAFKERQALARHLDIYMKSLFSAKQGPKKLWDLKEQYLAEGYTMDNANWNLFVRLLAVRRMKQSDETSEALAFSTCEVQLMGQWPGWLALDRQGYYQAARLRLKHAKGTAAFMGLNLPRPLLPGELLAMPKTLQTLDRVLAGLKDMALTSMESRDVLRAIKEQAPRTVKAIESMPADMRSKRERRYD